jgi:hypothetical protein
MGKKILSRLNMLKLLFSVSSLSLIISGAQVEAAPLPPNVGHIGSYLFTHTDFTQTNAAEFIKSLKAAAGGTVSASNARTAFNEVIAANPGISLEIIAAALNQLGLGEATLTESVAAISESFGIAETKIVSAMISDAYMNEGKEAVETKISALREVLGNETVDAALAQEQMKNFSEIAPAAGEEVAENTGLYDG